MQFPHGLLDFCNAVSRKITYRHVQILLLPEMAIADANSARNQGQAWLINADKGSTGRCRF
jgi:hypothetical protein